MQPGAQANGRSRNSFGGVEQLPLLCGCRELAARAGLGVLGKRFWASFFSPVFHFPLKNSGVRYVLCNFIVLLPLEAEGEFRCLGPWLVQRDLGAVLLWTGARRVFCKSASCRRLRHDVQFRRLQ